MIAFKKRVYWLLALLVLVVVAGAAATAVPLITSAAGGDRGGQECRDDDDRDEKDDDQDDADERECEDDAEGSGSQPCGTVTGTGCAPDNARVDLEEPEFSDPLEVTNPLYPVTGGSQTILLGHVEGVPLRIVYTVLPGTKSFVLNGEKVPARTVQFVAHLDRQILEHTLDYFAQAEDGSVWYLGEHVFNYEDGAIVDTDGTWLAGRDGPPGMIMPADPKVGDVFRVENIPGLVFEEVTIEGTGVTVDGPGGPIQGAVIASLLNLDGTISQKTFAPGYGEFLSGNAEELETVALTVPTDALPGPVPAHLTAISSGALAVFDAAAAGDWSGVSNALDAMTASWTAFQTGHVPPILKAQMDDVLASLEEAVQTADAFEARQAAIDVDRASLDLQLRYRAPSSVDLDRLDLWARQLMVDAEADDTGAVLSDAVTLKLIYDRMSHTLGRTDSWRIAAVLRLIRWAAEDEDIDGSVEAAVRLRTVLTQFP